MRLSELLEALEEKQVTGLGDPDITGLAYDSRSVEPGRAFFCIKGLVTDGHLYAGKAIERGAVALFVERVPEDGIPGDVVMITVKDTRLALALCSAAYYGRPSDALRLVGITGTNGKTTTAFLLEAILRRSGGRTGLIGTVENHITGQVEPVTRTTPESLDLQFLLRRMVDNGAEYVTMEVSSHALELHRVAGCVFDEVVFTNLTQDHLDFHISLEEYFGAKRRLFSEEEFGADRRAVINTDDSFGARLRRETALPTLSFGLDPAAEVRAQDVVVTPHGNRFRVEHSGGAIELETALQGRFNVYNCLAAAAVALDMGVDDRSIAGGLQSLQGVPGRFENIDEGQPFTVLVDYAHTPDGVRSLLEACREVTSGRVIVVVGCGGDRDRSKRPLMGRVAVELSDLAIVTSDNPRSEDPEAIIAQILEAIRGGFGEDRFMVEPDRREAIALALGRARPGDLVVVAGKGHESGQIFSDRVVPFDDRQVARERLREMLGETD
ncbi:MAG: UDP-N-acetylmuramoyl-L-alanyl-D-glutamate--2,6-diaminopimelate ligase [Actinobacteria bacterium]|nr:UDP-N-acetylmuramoyl-L-alanyl-D-glutamate--2,6-diaminopimelate ligase [Actinomycetota bacterium]MBU1944485.1 UDP-N-acetylmuramoyl-L-alanyl-D-glutamate--2,6-diaminopimelate ligase [Actinomycetota bacterium]MBU2688650.1 UDP-N-acetylmuramoyl-L-alanyl-D-glutamate--2,6-diaminopimelate ligase [Actinomycetota bacterium]